MEHLNNGMWTIGLILIPVIISIISFVIALILIFNMKKKHEKSISKIILTIILLIPMLYMMFTFVTSLVYTTISYNSYNTKRELCQDVEKLNYRIEQIDKWNYDIYIYDDDGNYYETFKNYYFAEPSDYEYDSETKERCTSLYKCLKGTVASIRVNLRDTTKFYIKDPTGNKILIWDYNDYLSAFAIQNLEIQKVGDEIYITEESLKNITIDYSERFFDYNWVIKRDDVQILVRAMSPQNLTLNFSDLKEEFYMPSGSYEIYLEVYSEWEEGYVKASNSITWVK